MEFRWTAWNLDHVALHGVTPDEAESLVRKARSPFPRKIEEDKWLVWGRGHGGCYLQVIFVTDDDQTVYIIHARPLTDLEKRRLRRIK